MPYKKNCKPKICKFVKKKNEKGNEMVAANIKGLNAKQVRELKTALNQFCVDFFEDIKEDDMDEV